MFCWTRLAVHARRAINRLRVVPMENAYLLQPSIKVVLVISRRKSRSVRRSEKRRRIQPPLRNGINAAPFRLPFSRDGEAEVGVPWVTMGQWFEERFGSQGLELLDRADVLAGHNIPLRRDDPYQPGERIWVFRPVLDEPEEPIILPIVAENERYIVVDKPHGMASVPKGSHVAQTVLVAARRQFANDLIVAAHRLDLETAGLLLLVKDPQWRGAYQKMFQDRHVRKTYRAIAPILGCNLRNLHSTPKENTHQHLPHKDIFGALGEKSGNDVGSDSSSDYLIRDLCTGVHDGSRKDSQGDLCPSRWHSELFLRKREGQLRVEIIRERETSTDVTQEKISADAGSSSSFCYYGEHRQAPERNGSLAVTDIEFVRAVAGEKVHAQLALYRLYPHTGFTHQLRVAMKELGAPIYADPLYPEILSKEEAAERTYPLQLLAESLDFIDPVSGEPTHVESARRLALE